MPTFASPWLLGLRSMFKSGVLHGVRKMGSAGLRPRGGANGRRCSLRRSRSALANQAQGMRALSSRE